MSDRSIICAFDASETARLAASTAGWLANAMATTLDIVYILDAGGALVAAPREGAGPTRCCAGGSTSCRRTA